jgi:hypothetical protein
MSESEILIGLAEIALGIAGFSGIVFALSPVASRTRSSVNALTSMVCNSVIVLIQSLVAIFILYSFESPWGWASTFSLATSLASLPIFFIVIPKVVGKLDISIFVSAPMMIISFSQLFIHGANLPIFGYSSFPIFFIAESCLLITALITFVYLILQLSSSVLAGEDT